MQMGFGPPPTLSQRIFKKYDTDGSGTINKEEFRGMCYELGHFLSDEELTMAMKVIDTSGDGQLSYNEFKKWWTSGPERFNKLQFSEEEWEVMHRATGYFKHFDTDRSGTLDSAEFKLLHADLVKNGMTALPLTKCMEDLDTDGDGIVSFNEYVDWLVRIGSIKVKVMDGSGGSGSGARRRSSSKGKSGSKGKK